MGSDLMITVTDRTTDFVIEEGFELADTYDWSIEWKAQLANASALFGTTASANNFVYLAYTVDGWKNPVRITTGEGTSYMIPLGDYMNKMTEMNKKKEEEAAAAEPPAPPAPSAEEVLLTEIRDLLKEKN